MEKSAPGCSPAPHASSSRPCLLAWLFAFLTGCAAYHPLHLADDARLPDAVPRLAVAPVTMSLPGLAPHPFDPERGLDEVDVAMLAVVNNPDLKLARADAGVARVQAFAAGILPNPQFAATSDVPTNDIPGSNYTAFTFGLSYDLRSLLTMSVTREAAEEDAHKTDLALLWQEWQVASKARQLFIQSLWQERLMEVLHGNLAVLEARHRRVEQALAAGDVTLDVEDADLSALGDARRQVLELEQKIDTARHDLNDLLGLSAEVRLKLVGESVPASIDKGGIPELLRSLPRRRPDLLALETGYQSQDLHYRKAILEQFPALTVSLSRGRDFSNVRSIGTGITINLPLFDHNQGQIAVEQATRQRLHDEYELRLAQARSGILRGLEEIHLLMRQADAVERELGPLMDAEKSAREALEEGYVNETVYVTLHSSLVAKKVQLIGLRQSLAEGFVALQALFGCELPPGRATPQTEGKPQGEVKGG